jgi:beta-lactamase class D
MRFQRLISTLLLFAAGSCVNAATPNVSAKLQQRFDAYGAPGAWLLQQDGGATRCEHGTALALKPQPPASSIKPLLALIALQTGALESADEPVPWNQRRYPNRPEWEREMALNEAMQTSSESYFSVLAERIGQPELARWITKAGYGNGQIGPEAALAWHDGVLTITARQQLDFVERLRTEKLPFDTAHMAAVKAAMRQKTAAGQQLFGKTGTHLDDNGAGVGWWVGWVEQPGHASSFVLEVELTKLDDRAARIALANRLLDDCGAAIPKPD